MRPEINDSDEKKLIERLKHLELQDVPLELTGRIMAHIATTRPGFFSRLFGSLSRPLNFSIRPVYACCAILALGLSFLLGRISLEQNAISAAPDPASVILSGETIDNARAAYLIGRGLLVADRQDQALSLLHHASLLAPGDPEIAYWEGVGYWTVGQAELERKSYLRGLAAEPNSLPLLVNLGHSYLSERRYEEALGAYRQALEIAPGEPAALYNSGLIYRAQQRESEERAAWKAYLQNNRSGRWAFRAVQRLNGYGDFSYRTYQIGARKVILAPDILLDDSLPEQIRRSELDVLAGILTSNPKLRLEVVVFVQHDSEMARNKAVDIKRLLVQGIGSDIGGRVALSWFGKPETVRVNNGTVVEQGEGLLLFGTSGFKQGSEVAI